MVNSVMKSNRPQPETANLLNKWEETYKKGLLSFWILLQIHQRPSYAFEMNALIEQLSQGSISAEDNSIYRALSRFESMGILSSQVKASGVGPDRRYYHLTDMGTNLLQNFVKRNLMIFQTPEFNQQIENLL
jgi:PadR family transcriptional regulator PadR